MQTDIFNRPSFAIYRDYSATKPSETISYSKLKAMMAQPFTLTDDSLNYENVADATPKIKAIKAQLQLCTPFISDGKTKAIAEISQFNSLVIDIDDTDKPIDDYLFKLEDDLGYSGAYSYFSTCSNGVGGLHGYKIVIPFETPLNMEDYARLANGAAMLFGGDKAQARLQQGFFAPNMVTEAHYETGGKDGTGKGLTAQDRLWQEAMGSYERHIQETLKAVQQTTAKPRPTSLHGNDNIINLINQSYAIDDLLLAKGHKLIAGKWLSPDSTSGAAGGIIFDNGKRFYSHHSTCKLGAVNNENHSLDAADILSIYEYGGDFNRMIKQQAERLDPQGQKERQIQHAIENAPQATYNALQLIETLKQPQTHEWVKAPAFSTTSSIDAIPFPINALPPVIAKAIQRTASVNNVPLSVSAYSYLGAMAYLAQKYINAPSDRSQKGQPCSLALLTIFPSGDGKDVCKDAAYLEIMKDHDKKVVEYNFKRKAWQSEPKEIKAITPPPLSPQAIFTRTTTQALIKIMAASHLDSFIWTTGEGAFLFNGYSLTSETVGDALATVNDLVDKGQLNSNLRGDDNAEFIINKRFTLDIAVQNVVAKNSLSNELLREQGFLARFLFTAPDGMPYREKQKGDNDLKLENDPDLIPYFRLCRRILDDSIPITRPINSGNLDAFGIEQKQVIVKSPEADQLHIDYENMILRECQTECKYYYIAPYAKRTRQYSLRIAGVLAFFKGELTVTAETMQGAIDICLFSLNEWLRYYSTPRKSDAEILWLWLAKQYKEDKSKIKRTRSSLMQCGPDNLRRANVLDEALNHLVELGYIRQEKMGKTTYIMLNPIMLR